MPPEKIVPTHPHRCGSLTTRSASSRSTQSRMRSVANPRITPLQPTLLQDLPRTPKDLKGPVGTHWDPKRTQKDLKRTRSGPAWDLLFYLILACRFAQPSISKPLMPPRPFTNIFYLPNATPQSNRNIQSNDTKCYQTIHFPPTSLHPTPSPTSASALLPRSTCIIPPMPNARLD